MKENQLVLPAEIQQIAVNVSIEKRNEVQTVLNQVFNGVSIMREQLGGVIVVDVTDNLSMKLAKTIRLEVRQVRLDAEKVFDAKRNEVQAQMLSYKTEDSLWLKAKQTMQILTKEIEENARWKEETKERFDTEQKELNVQQRILQVSKISPEIERSEFEHMSDSVFEIFFTGIEKAYNDKIEAEKQAEIERLAKIEAEKIENEKIRLENERLKKEAEEKEVELKKERNRIEKEKEIERKKQADILAAQKLENDRIAKIEADKNAKIQAELKAKADADAEIAAQKLAAERTEAKRLAAELKAKAEKEAKAEKVRLENIQKELQKGDSEKFESLILDLESLKTKYSFESDLNKKKLSDVCILIHKIILHIS